MASPPAVSRNSSISSTQTFATAEGDRGTDAPLRRNASTPALQAPPGLQGRDGRASPEESGPARSLAARRQFSLQHRLSLSRMSLRERLQHQAEAMQRLQEAAHPATAARSDGAPLQSQASEEVFYDALTDAGSDAGDSDTASILGSRRVDSSLGDPALPLRRQTRWSGLPDAVPGAQPSLSAQAGGDISGYLGDRSGHLPRAFRLQRDSSGYSDATDSMRFTVRPDQISMASTLLAAPANVVTNVTEAMYLDPPADVESANPQAPQTQPPTWGETAAALGATFGQRATTYFSAHAGAWLLQTASVAALVGARGGNASRESIATLSGIVGGASSAVLKEAVGETMKTMPRLGATIALPGTTVLQREGPRVMAGFNDMWTAIGGAMLNVAVNAQIGPVIEQSLKERGIAPELARPMSMMASALVQRMVSATADTVSDLTSTLAKSFLPGAEAATVVNLSVDRRTMLAGITARALLNFGLTLPLGPLITLRKVMADNSNPYQRTAASNAMSWASLNGWIVAKAHLASFYKSLGVAEPPPSAMEAPPLPPQPAPAGLEMAAVQARPPTPTQQTPAARNER